MRPTSISITLGSGPDDKLVFTVFHYRDAISCDEAWQRITAAAIEPHKPRRHAPHRRASSTTTPETNLEQQPK